MNATPLGAAVLAAAVAFASGVVDAQWDAAPESPPSSRSLHLLRIPYLHLETLRAAPAAGRLTVDVELGYANTFSHSWHPKAIDPLRAGRAFARAEAEELHIRHPEDEMFFVDGEVTRIALRASWGLSPELSLSAEIPFLSFSALHLDSGIESFHGAFGLADSQREDFPRGHFQIVRQRSFGPLKFDDVTPESGLGDATLAFSWRRQLSNRTSVGAEVVGKLPTGNADDLRGSGSADVGLLGGIEHRLFSSQRLALRLEAGVVVPGRFKGAMSNTFEVSTFSRLMASGQLRLGRGTYLSLAGIAEQSPLRNDVIGDQARTAIRIALGVSHRLTGGSALRLSIDENLPHYGDEADVTVSLGFSFR